MASGAIPGSLDYQRAFIENDNFALFTQWTYNSGNNAVKFNAGHVPAQGAQIKVTYYEP